MQKIKNLPMFAKIIIVVILGLGYFGYTKTFGAKSTTPTYQTATAAKGTLISTVTASGRVAATNSRIVTTTASGVVKKVYVTEGQKVTTGTAIMSIDLDMDGLQKYQSALASYQGAQNSLKSAQDKLYSLQSAQVNANNIFTNQWAMQSPDDPTYIQRHNDLLTAQAALADQQKVIQQATTSLESSRLSFQMAGATVYAPISGTVSAISLSPGMILNPTSNSSNSSNTANNIAIVKTNTTPAVSVSLTEIDAPKVKVGSKATITLDAFPSKTFTGKVTAVDTSGSVSSNVVTYTTTIKFDSDVAEVLSNMSANVSIITNVKNDVILVPTAAVQSSSGNSTVRILTNGQLSSVPVTIGDSDGTNTEIVSGVNEGDTVVTSVSIGTTTRTSTTGTSIFGGGARGGVGGAVFRGN
ncbi:MAG: efflux RND transporter periplasmic adaptor subunit [Candidatus Shapirobacteria bacterium]|nr:efflux RND transporter periplasmic adaptor subunit [Candidatus Shapirobacteria bacterium]